MPTTPDTPQIPSIAYNQVGWDGELNQAFEDIRAHLRDHPIPAKVYLKSVLLAVDPTVYQWCYCFVSNPDTGKPHLVYSDGVAWMYSDGTAV